ncbi:MAG: biotin/lipoyl-containing protein, partial [Streptomyces sp.]|uniref:biotin/lipoyl-containing protein n=1 Tax=Streptomyces sp. TaxID=1931 RepID=UPI003D6BCDC6
MTKSATRIREFTMPDVGEGLTEAEILTWYVKPGDTVTDGQVVCEVETAKAAVELPIPYDGAVHELRFAEGTTVDVGTAIISVDTDPSAGPVGGGEAGGTAESGAEAETAEAAEAPAEAAGEKRQPVLVGYGVAESPTKRRPRKTPSNGQGANGQAAVQGELNGHRDTAPAAAPAPAPPSV